MRESILSFEARIKSDPKVTLIPQNSIKPMYDPPVSSSIIPAKGLPK